MRGRSSWSRLTMAAAFGLVVLATNSLPGRSRGMLAVCSTQGCGWTKFVVGPADPRRCPRHPGTRRLADNGETVKATCRECGQSLPPVVSRRGRTGDSHFHCSRHGGA